MAISLTAWLVVSAYVLTTLLPGEQQCWRDAVASLAGAPLEYAVVGHVRAFFDYGSRVFYLIVFVAGGAGFYTYRGLGLLFERGVAR